jgi:phospholipid/cholesterol/gamma-HCH transport system ATP-binding protein
VARFGRRKDEGGLGDEPDPRQSSSSEHLQGDERDSDWLIGNPEASAEGLEGRNDERRYDQERFEEDQAYSEQELAAEPADEEEEQRAGGLTTESARAAEARADAATAEGDTAPERGGGPHVATDGAVLGRDFLIPGVDPEEADPYRWHSGRKRDHGGEDAIEVIDLVKQFGRSRILNGLNLGLPDDQISMVLGPSGTGKSVLIKHIVGLLYPDSGDVLVHGESVPNMTDDELFEVRKKFGLLFQDGALFGSMNLYDNVAFPLRQHTDKGEDEISEIVNRRLKEVGLIEAIYKMPNELSGGMRKRAGFARALVLDPAIVMFDEPDSGLDPVRTALLCELIREVHEENGGCYLVISHDIGTARRIADFLAVLWKGRIVESGPKEELFNSDNDFVAQFLNAEVVGPLAMD